MHWRQIVRPALSLLIASGVLQAAASLNGNIIEKSTGLPAAGATVDLHYSTSRATLQTMVTDNSGAFHFAVTETGGYAIDVSSPGYSP